ncbi:hypothetical protein F4808DRAFT_429194 [Astrocystis sublimbata]|nr:hypothetical protein F4808DRAFT_429194 [Astrocystis sublimbata]
MPSSASGRWRTWMPGWQPYVLGSRCLSTCVCVVFHEYLTISVHCVRGLSACLEREEEYGDRGGVHRYFTCFVVTTRARRSLLHHSCRDSAKKIVRHFGWGRQFARQALLTNTIMGGCD